MLHRIHSLQCGSLFEAWEQSQLTYLLHSNPQKTYIIVPQKNASSLVHDVPVLCTIIMKAIASQVLAMVQNRLVSNTFVPHATIVVKMWWVACEGNLCNSWCTYWFKANTLRLCQYWTSFTVQTMASVFTEFKLDIIECSSHMGFKASGLWRRQWKNRGPIHQIHWSLIKFMTSICVTQH